MDKKDGDQYVLNVQKWVNNTFSGKTGYKVIAEDGIVGWDTIYALLHGLQISLGITSTADNFGTQTVNAFNKYTAEHGDIEEQTSEITNTTRENINGIVQGALICKGYDIATNSPTGQFLTNTGNAVKRLKKDMGLKDTSTIITVNIMKALLSMDYFTSYSTSERVQNIVKMQRYLNGNYEDYIGIRPCDGVVGRSTSVALIYAIQAEEELPIGTANGNCGPATKKSLPPIPYSGGYTKNGQTYGLSYSGKKYSDDQISKFKKLACIGLYFNGYGSGELTDNLNTETIQSFQKMYALPVTGNIDYTTWLSLLISCGDTERSAIACDCVTKITENNINVLIHNGYKYIGRYLSGTYIGPNGEQLSKALTLDEIKLLFKNGICLFPIHQGGANKVSYFTTANAEADAEKAVESANSFYLQFGTIIYFAVDCDVTDVQVTNAIIPYFKALYKKFMTKCKGMYRVGIYGTRNTCERVCKEGYACSSFVSDMSTGYSGNLGFPIPSNWAFDQFTTTKISYSGESIEIDKDGFSGNYKGISQEYSLPETEYTSNLNTLENSFLLANMGGVSIPVYESKVHKNWPLPQAGTQYVVDGEIIAQIKPYDFYLFFGVSNPSTDNVHKVLYNDGTAVKMGFITGKNYVDTTLNIVKQNYAQAPEFQEPYSCVRYSPKDNTYTVEPAESTHEILINKPVVYFYIDGTYAGMLNKNDKVYISWDNFNNTGVTRPWCYRVAKFEKNGELINKEVYVSTGLEYASSGSGRAWY